MIKLILISGFLALVMAKAIIDEKKVEVVVFYESLCSDSIKFINEQLYPTYQQLNSIIDLKLVPAGNSNVSLRAIHDMVINCYLTLSTFSQPSQQMVHWNSIVNMDIANVKVTLSKVVSSSSPEKTSIKVCLSSTVCHQLIHAINHFNLNRLVIYQLNDQKNGDVYTSIVCKCNWYSMVNY